MDPCVHISFCVQGCMIFRSIILSQTRHLLDKGKMLDTKTCLHAIHVPKSTTDPLDS